MRGEVGLQRVERSRRVTAALAPGLRLCSQTEPVCHAILDGLTDAGRAAVVDCVEAFCTSDSFALDDCVADLFIF